MAEPRGPGITKEHALLAGWDPHEPVPAFIYRPPDGDKLPVILFTHGLGRDKEFYADRLVSLASAGFLVIAIDDFLHGERREGSVFPPHMGDLVAPQAVWVHQTCVSRTALDVGRIIEQLDSIDRADPSRLGLVGVSMGGDAALVATACQPRVSAVVTFVSAADAWWDVTRLPPGPERDARQAGYSPRLRQLVHSLDPTQHAEQMHPRAVLMMNAGRDPAIEPRSVEPYIARLRSLYGADAGRVGFVVEPEAGHKVTDTMWPRMIDWVVRYVKDVPTVRPGSGRPG